MSRKSSRPVLEALEERCVLDATFGKLFTTEHIDLALDFAGGAWDVTSETGGVNPNDPALNYRPEATLHHVAPGAQVARPSGSQWDFLGVAAGQPVWALPQNQDTSLLYLGVAAEETPINTFAKYSETDPRLPSLELAWITGKVTAVRGPSGAVFSMWHSDPFGAPIPWVSVETGTAPDASDKFVVIEGGHAHYSWGFTKPGLYEIDVRASAYLGPGQTNQTQSAVHTFFFHVADTLQLTSVTPTAGGFLARFNRPIDLSRLNLYDTAGGSLGPADVTLVGPAGPVRGSLVVPRVDNRQEVVAALNAVEFIATGGPLPSGTYTLTLRSHNVAYSTSTGFRTPAAPADTSVLDGNGDGTPGDSFTTTLVVATPAAGTRTLSIGDFARGPGQAVNLPITGNAGIPLTLSDGSGVRSVSFTLSWDPRLLQLGTATTGLAGWTVNAQIDNAAGRATFTASGPQSAPAGPVAVLNLTASVPSAGANAIYGSKHVLDLSGLEVRDGASALIPSLADDGLHAALYVGDVSGNGAINAADAAATAVAAVFAGAGFDGTQNLDPRLVGDVSTNGVINAVDPSQIARRAAGQDVPTVPAPPVTVNAPTGGPDPKVSVGSLAASPGTSIAVPVTLDSIVNLQGPDAIVGFRLSITYDPAKLTYTGVANGAFLNRPGWQLTVNSSTPGELILLGFTTQPVSGQFVEGMLSLNFDVAPGASGPTVVNLRQQLGGLNTELNSLADTALPLIPAPTDAATDAVDGTITFTTDPNGPPVNTLPAGPIALDEDTPKVIAGLSIADPDAGPANVQFTLAVTGGTLAVDTGVVGGVGDGQVGGNGTGTVVLTAPLAAINATLAHASGLTYTPPAGFSGDHTLTVTTDDLGNTGTGGALSDTDSVTLSVAAVNDPPVNTLPAGPLETTPTTALVLAGFSVADADAGAANVTVTFAVTGGTLTVNTTVAGGVGAGQVVGNGTGTVVLTAPLAAINATLAHATGLTYTPNPGFSGTDTLSMTTDDQGNTGGPPQTDRDTIFIRVLAPNQAPVVTVPTSTSDPAANPFRMLTGRTQVFSQAGGSAITVTDPDAGTADVRVTLTVPAGTLTLATTAGLAVTGNGTGSVTLTGPLSALNAALDDLTYTAPQGFAGNATISVTADDLGHEGTGGPLTDTGVVNVTVVGVYLNEVLFTPPGSPTTTREYIEVRTSAPGFTLPQGTYLVVVEGDTGKPNRGDVNNVFNLSGRTTGSNGMLVVLPKGHAYTPAARAAVLANAGAGKGFGNGASSSIGHTADGKATGLEGNSATFFLIQSAATPALTTDIDANNDGTADGAAFAGWRVLDSVGLLDGSAKGDRGYGQVNFRTGKRGSGGNVVPLAFLPGYLARVGASTGNTSADWVASRLTGTPARWLLSRKTTTPAALKGHSADHLGAANDFPPVAAGVTVGAGKPERSMVTRLVVTFNSLVSIADAAAAFELAGPSGDVGVSIALATVSGRTQATITFVPGTDTYAAGSAVALNDGDYTLTVVSTQVLGSLGQALDGDGDGDGAAGGDLVFAFHRFFGDADGDRDVDIKDQTAFNASLNRRLGQPGYARHFDYDGSGRVDQVDQAEFLQRLGTSL